MTVFRTLPGAQHKRQRKMLNPVFSAKHLREMMPLFYQVVHKVRRPSHSPSPSTFFCASRGAIIGLLGFT